MSTSLEASTLNSPTACTPNSYVNLTDSSLDHSGTTNFGLFVQRKRPVSLGSEADVTFQNIVQEYKQAMTSPVRYYKRSTDCFPSTPNPEVVVPDAEFLVEWYKENYWKVEAHDNARIQLLEILAKYLPGYGLSDSDPLEAYISVVEHHIDELNTKLIEFDIDIGQISGGEIAGRIESHKTRVFFIIGRYKRMLDSANEVIYQLRDHIAHLDSELTGVLQINSSLRRAMANGDPETEATADLEGRAAAALSLSANLQQELQRSRRETQQLYQSVNQLTNQSLSTHEECMQVLAGLTQKIEINSMLEEAIRNHITQLGASMDQADRVVEDWYNSIVRALGERDLEIADLQQRVQYKNNEIARLSAVHEDLLRQSGELEDWVRRAKETIMMQEAEAAKMEELGINRTFNRPMNFTYNTVFEGSVPCGFGPTESTGELEGFSEYLSPARGGTFAIPVVNRTVTVPVVNRTFTPTVANVTGSPLNTTQTVAGVVGVPSPVYVQSPPTVVNTTGRVSPVISETSPAAVIGGGFIDDSFDQSFEVGPSVGKVNNTIDIGKGLNITTSVSGSPRGLKQWATVDNLLPESDPDSSMSTTGFSPRSHGLSASSGGSLDDGFYLPGGSSDYSARLRNYRSTNVQSHPRRRIYRKPSPGKSIRHLSDRQCLTDMYAPTVGDMTQYATMNNLSSVPRNVSYNLSPRSTYAGDRLVDSPPVGVNTTVCISPRSRDTSASSGGSPAAVITPWFIDNSDDSFNSSGSCDGRYIDLSKVIIPDEMVDDVFYLPGEPLDYPARLKNYRSANVRSFPRRRIYRKPSAGKSIRNLSERQCLTDMYAPTIDDMTQYPSPKGTYTYSSRGTYSASPKGTYTYSPTNFSYPSYTASPLGEYTYSPTRPYASTQDSPLKKSVLLKTPNRKAPFVLDIDVVPQPIVETESGEHIVCDVSLDVQDTQPVIKSDYPRDRIFSYSTPPTTYSPRSPQLGTPKSIFEKNYYAIRNLAAKFDEEDYELPPVMDQMSPNRTLTPSPQTDLDTTY